MAEQFSVLTDLEGCLSTVSDDARTIIGRSEEDICAKPLFDLFADEDATIVADALKSASNANCSELTDIRLHIDEVYQPRFDITIEPGGTDKFYLFFTLAAGEVAAAKANSKEQFLATAADRCGLADISVDRMVMLDFDGLRAPELAAKLGEDGARKVRAAIERALATTAIDGQIGQLGEASYGVLRAADSGMDEIVAAAVAAADALGVSESDLGIRLESVKLDGTETDPDTLNRQLSHVCNKFQQVVRSDGTFGLDELNKVEADIDEAVKSVEFALERGNVTVTARNVWGLQSGDVSFQLVQGALIIDEESVPADRLLVLADHPQLCARYDRAVVEAAVETLSGATVVIDIGLPTLESGEAARIGAEHSLAGRFIGFRPLEMDITNKRSLAVRELDQLLKAGIVVWLADFSTAIPRTRQLRGAYVEVAATFLREISARPDNDTLLSSLLDVWHEVEVSLVAVNLDTKDLASLANKLGIAYGVGLAADPTADVPSGTGST
ncbi:MAG: EAL domain-containing protein [Alphaproteobacteria bacterium]|nr:EAL domain-containing protein [Alphaproteobacteria bacterium]